MNLRSEDNTHCRTLLLQKLHARYKFLDEFNNLEVSGNCVNNAAISKMSTALDSWKVRVKKLILVGKTFEEANNSNPTLTENDYEEMRLKCDPNDVVSKRRSLWGKEL
jgi:hypothetical protein